MLCQSILLISGRGLPMYFSTPFAQSLHGYPCRNLLCESSYKFRYTDLGRVTVTCVSEISRHCKLLDLKRKEKSLLLCRNTIQIPISPQINLIIHHSRRGLKSICQYTLRQHLKFRPMSDHHRRSVPAHQINPPSNPNR